MGPCFRRDDKWEYHLHASNSLPCPDTVSPSRGAFRPRVAGEFRPSPIRGRREHRVHAAPAVSCATVHKTNAHEHTGSAEAIRHSLRNGFTAYFALSPVSRAFLPPPHLRSLLLGNLTPASGRQDHTTLPSASAPFVCRRIRVHRIPPRVRDNREPPLEWDGTANHIA